MNSRRLIVLGLLVATLSACSTTGPNNNAPTTAAPTNPTTAAPKPFTGPAADPPSDYVRYGDVKISEGRGSSQASDGVFPRTITHEMGEVTIEKPPTRVVVLSAGQLDHVISLGVVPVGATNALGAELIPDYLPAAAGNLAGQLNSITSVGQRSEPNFEQIAKLKPDLILGNQAGLKDSYQRLNSIAPTVFVYGQSTRWREDYLLLAAALGRQQQAEKVLDDLSAKTAQAATKFSQPRPVVSLVRFSEKGARAMGTGATAGLLMAEMGFRRPEIAPSDKNFTEVSQEELAKLDGDVIFYATLGKGEAKPEQAPLWASLNAVRTNRAFEVSDNLWFQSPGPLGTQAILSEFEQFLS